MKPRFCCICPKLIFFLVGLVSFFNGSICYGKGDKTLEEENLVRHQLALIQRVPVDHRIPLQDALCGLVYEVREALVHDFLTYTQRLGQDKTRNLLKAVDALVQISDRERQRELYRYMNAFMREAIGYGDEIFLYYYEQAINAFSQVEKTEDFSIIKGYVTIFLIAHPMGPQESMALLQKVCPLQREGGLKLLSLLPCWCDAEKRARIDRFLGDDAVAALLEAPDGEAGFSAAAKAAQFVRLESAGLEQAPLIRFFSSIVLEEHRQIAAKRMENFLQKEPHLVENVPLLFWLETGLFPEIFRHGAVQGGQLDIQKAFQGIADEALQEKACKCAMLVVAQDRQADMDVCNLIALMGTAKNAPALEQISSQIDELLQGSLSVEAYVNAFLAIEDAPSLERENLIRQSLGLIHNHPKEEAAEIFTALYKVKDQKKRQQIVSHLAPLDFKDTGPSSLADLIGVVDIFCKNKEDVEPFIGAIGGVAPKLEKSQRLTFSLYSIARAYGAYQDISQIDTMKTHLDQLYPHDGCLGLVELSNAILYIKRLARGETPKSLSALTKGIDALFTGKKNGKSEAIQLLASLPAEKRPTALATAQAQVKPGMNAGLITRIVKKWVEQELTTIETEKTTRKEH